MTAPLVLVTGVSGFIASWVAHAALKVGYRVRGTVRSLKNEDKVKHLRDLCPGSKYQLELVEADLTSDAGWNDAVRDCDYILHLASPFPLDDPKDPNELIVPAVDGTLRVLRAAAALDKPPKRVVLTSSIVAVTEGQKKPTFDENDWTVTDSRRYPVSPYSMSKTYAEKAAWDFIKTLPDEKKIELAVINPSFVVGPMLSTTGCSSADLMSQIIMGQIAGLPKIRIEIVSVYDVAVAHLLAMTHPHAAGKRFLTTSASTTLQEMGDIINQEFRQYGYRPTTMHVSNTLMQVLAWMGDSMAKRTVPFLSYNHVVVPHNAKAILGMELKKDLGLIKEMTLAAIHAGLIPDRSPDKQLTKNYVRPEFDTSMIPPAPEI